MCRLTLYLRENPRVADGDRLTAVSPTRFLALIRAALTVAGVQRAAEATLKMFRAGHATTMAAAGEFLGGILLDCEWTSAAFRDIADTAWRMRLTTAALCRVRIDGSGDAADEVAPIIRPEDYISGQNEVCDFNDI